MFESLALTSRNKAKNNILMKLTDVSSGSLLLVQIICSCSVSVAMIKMQYHVAKLLSNAETASPLLANYLLTSFTAMESASLVSKR